MEFRAPKFAFIGHAWLNYSIVLTWWQPVIVFVCPPTLSIHCFSNPLKHSFPTHKREIQEDHLAIVSKTTPSEHSHILFSWGARFPCSGSHNHLAASQVPGLMKVFVNVKSLKIRYEFLQFISHESVFPTLTVKFHLPVRTTNLGVRNYPLKTCSWLGLSKCSPQMSKS